MDVVMMKPYVKPVTTSYNVDCQSRLLTGSGNDTAYPNRNYQCPYIRSFCCTRYSDHMNAWAATVIYESNGKTNPDDLFYAHLGCMYKNTCDIYKYYMFYKEHHNDKK